MPPSPNSDDTKSLLFQLGTRIDSLEKIPMSAGVPLAISLASFFTYYDFSNYAYISPMLKESWNVQDSEIALGASLTVLGYVIGAVLITIYADLYGRKPALVISVLLLAGGSILTASAQDMTQMVIFRLITGIGIGSEIAIVTTYIGEISPKSKRGRYTSLIVFFWMDRYCSIWTHFFCNLPRQNQQFCSDRWLANNSSDSGNTSSIRTNFKNEYARVPAMVDIQR